MTLSTPGLRGLAAATVLLLLGAPALQVPAGAEDAPAPTVVASDLPTGGPPALYAPEPALPAPAAWPFGEDFSRTSGSGRYAGGAHFWTDWIYDDHGAIGTGQPYVESPGAPSPATYKYSGDPTLARAHNNGADVFRSAVGVDGADTLWRVDWNTLADPAIPAAAFAIDTDGDAATGGRFWGANSGLMSAGIEKLLFVNGSGAWLRDTTAPLPQPVPPYIPVAELGGSYAVDLASRSFVVRLPRAAVGGGDRATVRLASGLADATLPIFRTLDARHGALPGQPNVFNVAYREAHVDEPDDKNAWFETGQTAALTAGGDVSAFAATVDWSRLAARDTEPEPLVTGFVNRWYVSTVEPGQGTAGGVLQNPAYLGRVQPYMAYVPTTYQPGSPASLTFILHGLTANHNSSPATSPKYLQQACEARGSICVSTLGRGPAGWYKGLAELDVWESWKAVAAGFDLDPDRTTMSGTSMGGAGTYRLVTQYPHLFAAAGLITPSTSGIVPAQLANLRWTPYYQYQGNLDQLTPISGGLATIATLKELGYRFTFDHYVAEDHILNALKDGFSAPAEFFGNRTRVTDPGRISYVWQPADVDSGLGLGPAGAWWVSGVQARDARAPTARVEADSRAKPFAAEPFGKVPVEYTEQFRADADPSPATRKEQRWVETAAPASENLLLLQLSNVRDLTVDVARAGLDAAQPATVTATSDGATSLVLTALAPGSRVSVAGAEPVTTDGTFTASLPAGTTSLTILPPAAPDSDADGDGILDTAPPSSLEDCSGNGWKRYNNPTFSKKKECTDYVSSRSG